MFFALLFFTGLGYGAQVVVFYSSIYYIIILAWAILYLYFSFSSELPWATCNNPWNTGKLQQLHMYVSGPFVRCIKIKHNSFFLSYIETCVDLVAKNISALHNATSPVLEFWE